MVNTNKLTTPLLELKSLAGRALPLNLHAQIIWLSRNTLCYVTLIAALNLCWLSSKIYYPSTSSLVSHNGQASRS